MLALMRRSEAVVAPQGSLAMAEADCACVSDDVLGLRGSVHLRAHSFHSDRRIQVRKDLLSCSSSGRAARQPDERSILNRAAALKDWRRVPDRLGRTLVLRTVICSIAWLCFSLGKVQCPCDRGQGLWH